MPRRKLFVKPVSRVARTRNAITLSLLLLMCCGACSVLGWFRGDSVEDALLFSTSASRSTAALAVDAPTSTDDSRRVPADLVNASDATDFTPDAPPSATTTLISNVCPCESDTFNCADFSGPEIAQACYYWCDYSVGNDVHLLDSDGNGLVCESVWPAWATSQYSPTPTTRPTITSRPTATRRPPTATVYIPPTDAPAPTSVGGVRVGARCRDGSSSSATGRGACSHHGGVSCWRYSDGTCR